GDGLHGAGKVSALVGRGPRPGEHSGVAAIGVHGVTIADAHRPAAIGSSGCSGDVGGGDGWTFEHEITRSDDAWRRGVAHGNRLYRVGAVAALVSGGPGS